MSNNATLRNKSDLESYLAERLGVEDREEMYEQLGLDTKTSLRARISAMRRNNHDTSELERRLKIALMAERIQREVDQAPELSERQWSKLSAIIENARESQHGNAK